MDWHSRYVVAWRLSNTLEAGFCHDGLTEALARGRPEVFNTDQGSQFSSREFTQVLQDRRVKISMDGNGRYADNIFVERMWRTVKYEELYLKAYATPQSHRGNWEPASGSTTTRGAPPGVELPDPGRGVPRRSDGPGGRVKAQEVFRRTRVGIICRSHGTLT